MKLYGYLLIPIVALMMMYNYTPYQDMDWSKVTSELIADEKEEGSILDNGKKDIDKGCDSSILVQNKVDRIVIHHTATSPNVNFQTTLKAINQYHMKHWANGVSKYGIKLEEAKGVGDNPWIMYHALIGAKGEVSINRGIKQIGWGGKMCSTNWNTYHIALVGNFNLGKPTEVQLKALEQEIKKVKSTYPNAKVTFHKSVKGEKTACPGNQFPYDRFKEGVVFSLSRYYSPLTGQSRYYNNKTYEADVTMNCGASAIGNNGCIYPANGMELKHELKGKVVACPPQFKLGTKFNLDGIGVVECVDRGGAIQMEGHVIRLDIWCGLGEKALDERKSCPSGKNISGKVL